MAHIAVPVLNLFFERFTKYSTLTMELMNFVKVQAAFLESFEIYKAPEETIFSAMEANLDQNKLETRWRQWFILA